MKINLSSNAFLTFRAVSFSDKLLFGKIILLVFFVEKGLKTFGFNRIVNFLKLFITDRPPNPKERETIKRYFRLLKSVHSFFPTDGKCLAVSLVFWWLLQRKRIETELRFGMSGKSETFSAHAWLEYGGEPLTVDGKIREKYSPFIKSVL